MSVSTQDYVITWSKLPDDFPLENEPVDNIDQPLIAGALSEILELANHLRQEALVASNFGLVATINGKIVIKAPDWLYVPSVLPAASSEVRRSYTPQVDGEVPAIVMEFLSDTRGEEYSIKPSFPPGKWFFYEQVLQVPTYGIFAPVGGVLEVYKLDDAKRYRMEQPDANNRYWVEGINLFLGVWQGTKENRTGYWLRWWDESGQMLPWGSELVEQERQRAEQERQRAERLAAQLRAAGIEPME